MKRRAFLSLPAAALAPKKAYSFLWDNPFSAGALTPRRWNEIVLAKLRAWERNGSPSVPLQARSRMVGKRIESVIEVLPPPVVTPEFVELARRSEREVTRLLLGDPFSDVKLSRDQVLALLDAKGFRP